VLDGGGKREGECDGGAEWRREGGDRLGMVGLCKKLGCDRGSKRGADFTSSSFCV
jgi:hypothetical protein